MDAHEQQATVFYNKRAIMSHPDFHGHEEIIERLMDKDAMYTLNEAYNLVTRELLRRKD